MTQKKPTGRQRGGTARHSRGGGRRVPAADTKVGRRGQVRLRNPLWRWRRFLFVLGLLFVGGIAGAGWVLSQVALPEDSPLDQTSFVCAADVVDGCTGENAIASFHAEQNRINVELDDVPDVMVQAVVATEDRDFFSHKGVDPVGIARAAWTDIRKGEAAQGGSTITQQYVKNVYLTNEHTLVRKVKEAVLSVKLEQELEKDEILERYLNTVYFGRGAYGVQAAATVYFARDVGDLTLSQSAFLAGLIRAPESADPTDSPTEASRRRQTVLDAMVAEGYVTPDAATEAAAQPWDSAHVLSREPADELDIIRRDAEGIGATYFVEEVRKLLADRYGEEAVYSGGLRVYTTLDLGMQRAAYETVTETLDAPDDPDGALVALDDRGHVAAMMAGEDFVVSEVNLAMGQQGGGSGRQPGSTFKTFALAEAVEAGWSARSVFRAPEEVTIRVPGQEPWRPTGGDPSGRADLIEATRNSTNTVYAQLMDNLGAESVVDMANQMGVSAELPAVPALVLGSGEVSVLDMAAGYSTLANRGVHKPPIMITRVEDADGNVLDELAPEPESVISEGTADTVTYALEQVIDGGTGRRAAIGRPAAGKTGTTQDNHDAWFVGYTPQLTAAVWMGHVDEPRPMTTVDGEDVQGGNVPAEMWSDFMERATEDMEPLDFVDPPPLSEGDRFNAGLGLSTDDDDDDGSSGSSGGSDDEADDDDGSSSASGSSESDDDGSEEEEPPSTTEPEPDPTTTTTAPPSTTTSTTTTTTAPPSTTTTTAPSSTTAPPTTADPVAASP